MSGPLAERLYRMSLVGRPYDIDILISVVMVLGETLYVAEAVTAVETLDGVGALKTWKPPRA
jgi:hypothetical protein